MIIVEVGEININFLTRMTNERLSNEIFKIINEISNYGRNIFHFFLSQDIYCPDKFNKACLLTHWIK